MIKYSKQINIFDRFLAQAKANLQVTSISAFSKYYCNLHTNMTRVKLFLENKFET